jgi:Outer membrane protein beta-barrel domain
MALCPDLIDGAAMSILFAMPPARSAAGCLAGLVLAATTLTASPAQAANDFSIGVGVGAARGRVDCVASFPCDRSGTSAGISAAYRFSDSIDLRAQYFGAGSFKGGDTSPLGTEFGGTFKVGAIGLTGGYTWTFAPAWSLSGRLGFASVRTRFEYASPFTGSASKTTTQPLIGAGIGYAITPTIRLGVDYDATRFKVHTNRGPLQMLGVAAQFSF